MSDTAPHQLTHFPRARRLVVDVGRLAAGRPVIRGLLELDVTVPRRRLRALRETEGTSLSFTAYLAACVGDAVAAHPEVHACRDWRGRLVVFEDVDIATMVEVERDGHRFPVGHIVRAANTKSVRAIHDEIRAVQSRPDLEQNVGRLLAFTAVPRFLRRPMLRLLERAPHVTKRIKGTVVLTSIGMFGTEAGWGVALPTHSLGLTVGGIAPKPRYIDGTLEPRDILHLTLDFDHDLVDGAPAARFAHHFAQLVESATRLPAPADASGPAS